MILGRRERNIYTEILSRGRCCVVTSGLGLSVHYAYMKGTALESVMDICLTGPETVSQVLDEYQNHFLPESDSQLLRAQFSCVVKLPNESVQKLHARMRVLYHLAYPDGNMRNKIFLIERFISALNNR